MSEIRWTDKVWLDSQGNIHDMNEQRQKNLTYEQIQNLRYDGFFDDMSCTTEHKENWWHSEDEE